MLLLLLFLLSILNGIFGSFIVWNNIVNYFDNFTHSAIFSVVIGHVFHLNEFYTLIVFSSIFSLLLCICISLKIKLNNNLLTIVGSAFIGFAALFNNTCNDHENHNHEHFEDGMLSLFLGNNLNQLKNLNINNYLILSIILLLTSAYYYKNWLKMVLNNQLIPMIKKDYLIYFLFLISVGLFSILAVKVNGVLLAIGTSILPVFITKFFAKTPHQMIIYSIIFNSIITIFSFSICNKFNINYNGFVITLEFLILIFLNFKYSFYEKQA
jgi:ABC-type Mn2+/Zn2+ transport system permease subunit